MDLCFTMHTVGVGTGRWIRTIQFNRGRSSLWRSTISITIGMCLDKSIVFVIGVYIALGTGVARALHFAETILPESFPIQ